MKRRAAQRSVPKRPHKPSSMRRGTRRSERLADKIARAFAFMNTPLVLHPIDWQPIRLTEADAAAGVLGFGRDDDGPA